MTAADNQYGKTPARFKPGRGFSFSLHKYIVPCNLIPQYIDKLLDKTAIYLYNIIYYCLLLLKILQTGVIY